MTTTTASSYQEPATVTELNANPLTEPPTPAGAAPTPSLSPRTEVEPSLRIAFARAVMDRDDRRVIQVRPDNSSGEWVELESAVASGDTYSAAVRFDMIALDGDDADSATKAVALARRMEEDGLQPVVWASGRPGHAQIVSGCPSTAKQRHWRREAEALGFQWKRRTRPPLSPHRLGLPVGLLFPTDPDEALRRLNDRIALPRTGRLTPRTMALLKNGDPSEVSGSETVFRIVMGAVATGVGVDKIEALLADPANAGGAAYRRRMGHSPQTASKWLRQRVLPRAIDYIRDHPPILSPDDARDHLDRMRSEAMHFDWQPVAVERRTAFGSVRIETISPNSLRRGLNGILDLAYRRGTIHLALSQTILIRATGMSAPTVHKLKKALIRQGWLSEITEATYSWSGTYRLNLTGTRISVPNLPGPHLRIVQRLNTRATALSYSHTPPGGGVEEGGKP